MGVDFLTSSWFQIFQDLDIRPTDGLAVRKIRLKDKHDEYWIQLKTPKTSAKLERHSAMNTRVAVDTRRNQENQEHKPVNKPVYRYHPPSINNQDEQIIRNKFRVENMVSDTTTDNSITQHRNDTKEINPIVDVVNGRHSMWSVEQLPDSRIAKRFLIGSKPLNTGNPIIHLLIAKENSISIDLRRFEIGEPSKTSQLERDHKIIILMGATGSGKSTLIDGMANYILGVQWDDSFRFKCVREDESVTRNQAHSQTSSVTAYTIHHHEGMAVPYSITLIDTPGYGDTRGVDKDKEITQMIHQFLMGNNARIDHIHAACFVAASGDSRLTVTQRYILNSVLSIFGKDFRENIRLLVTFADNATPPVIEACRVANFPVTSPSEGIVYSKFNSSVLYAFSQREKEPCFDKLFWDMGQENFQKFFTMLEGMNGKDLKSTRQVIQHRKLLEQTLKQTENELEEYFTQIEMLRRRPAKKSKNLLKVKMLSLLNQVDDSIRSLESSALHWDGFSLSDYLSLMMSHVAEEQKPGYEVRLETLAELQQLILAKHAAPPESSIRDRRKWFSVIRILLIVVILIIVAWFLCSYYQNLELSFSWITNSCIFVIDFLTSASNFLKGPLLRDSLTTVRDFAISYRAVFRHIINQLYSSLFLDSVFEEYPVIYEKNYCCNV